MIQLLEKRRYKRFIAPEGMVALVGDPLTILGTIMDLSENGLSFRYIHKKKQAVELSRLDILYSDKLIYIEHIPFRAVFDIELSVSDIFRIRRCGIQFKQLTERQFYLLKYLICNHSKSIQKKFRAIKRREQ